MTDRGSDLSMYKRVEQHDELINNEILPRLEVVEAGQLKLGDENEVLRNDMSSIKTDIASIRNAQGSLELTVLKDGAQTRDILLNRFVDHYLDSDGRKITTTEKVTLTKLGTKEKVWLALIGALSAGIASVTTFFVNFYN